MNPSAFNFGLVCEDFNVVRGFLGGRFSLQKFFIPKGTSVYHKKWDLGGVPRK